MTLILDSSRPEEIEQAAEFLRLGRLVAFPTDTLYGVGADVTNKASIDMLYTAKNRPREKGIPLLLSHESQVDNVARNISPEARMLMEQYWPGPLTLILFKRPCLLGELSPNQGIAVRVPDHRVAQQFIEYAGGAIAATSANKSGSDPALTAAQAELALPGSLAAVLDGGAVRHGTGSTILDFTSTPPRLLRPGPIPASDLSVGDIELA
jgi:L-threonylcarbamoyladenylate synthase